jgi:cation transport ATPase
MQHQRSYTLFSYKSFILLIALFISMASSLSAAPPIDILDHREVVIEKTERKAARAAKKRWKKEIRKKELKQKTRKQKARQKANRRNFFKVLIIIGTVIGTLFFVGLTGFAITFGEEVITSLILYGTGALIFLLVGLWGISKINGNNSRFWKIIELILIVIATITLLLWVIFLMVVVFRTPLSYLLLSLLGGAILFFGVWLIIRLQRRRW